MTRAAVDRGFKRYVDALVDETAEAFDVGRALRGQGGGRVADRLLSNSRRVRRRVIDPELETYRRGIRRQLDVVLDYAADDAPFEAYADEVLDRDLYWDALQRDVGSRRRERIRESLLARQRALGDAVEPLVAHEADDLWAAAADAYDRERVLALVERQFALTPPLREDRDAYALAVRVDPGDLLGGLARALPSITVDYTDEAIRAMGRAEQRVIERAKADADEQF